MMEITIEPLSQNLIDETESLIQKNYEETGQFHEPLDIDWGQYISYGDGFIAFILRVDKVAVGVLFFVLATYPHVKSLIMAQQLTFYVEPEHRRYSLGMLTKSEEFFKEHDIDFILQSSRCGSKFTDVLNRRGYKPTDILHIKRLT